MKSTKLFTILLASVLVAMLLSTGAVAVYSQSATPAATVSAAATAAPTAVGTAVVAVVKYCTPAIAVANQQKDYLIAVVSKGFASQFWAVVRQGVFAAASDCGVGVSYEGPQDETKVADQLDMLTVAVGRNPSAIVFAALDTKAATSVLQQAQAKNIPIIGLDSGVANDIPVTTAQTDNLAAAAVAADHMAALIGGSGNIAIVAHDQVSQTAIQRRDGFVNEIKAKYPNIKIVDIKYPTGGDPIQSDDDTKALIQANPDLKGIYFTNQTTVDGGIQALTELSIPAGKLVIIGFDSGKAQIDAINAGFETGAITQSPYGMGYKSIEAAVKILNGVSVPKTIDTGFFWYDKTNITDPNIALLLYQ
jgi:ribose transport system substrate-binding protein